MLYRDRVTRRPLRLLHTSDVHLGPRSFEPTGLLHTHECLCPVGVIESIVDAEQVDVVLIAGDLFDHARVSEELVVTTLSRLGALRADVALLPGNHDVFDDIAVYRRHRGELEASSIHFFDEPAGRIADLADGALRIWARAMEAHTPHNHPLADPPPHPGDRWFVAAAHGHFVESPIDDAHRSSRISIESIEATAADYVALGHWHVTTDLSARGVRRPAWYPGAPLFGYGAGQMLLIDFVPGVGPVVRPVPVLNHAASRCIETAKV